MKQRRFWLVLALLLALLSVQLWVVSRSGRAAREKSPDDGLTVSTVTLSAPIVSWGGLGGVAVDQLGFIYMANFAESVWKIAPDGTIELWGEGLNGASGNAIDRNGDLLQASQHDNTIRRIDRGGEMTAFAEQGLDGPLGLWAAPDGDVFVCNCLNDTIVRVRGIGAEQTVDVVAAGNLFDCPNGITGDAGGNLYVTNFDNDLLVRITPDGGLSTVAEIAPANGYSKKHIEMDIRGNSHLALAGDRFYVAKSKTNSIWEVTLDGNVRHFAGNFKPEYSDELLTRAGIAHPNGIALSGDTLFFNTIDGPWRTPARGELRLRRIELGAD